MDLVLVPGFMMDAALWDDVVDPFRAVGPITYGDLSRDTGIADMARRVVAEALAGFALIGFSMGGYVAREIVRIAPGRVQALVLVDTSARADTSTQARKATAVENVIRSGFTGLSWSVVASSLHLDRADDAAMIERIRQLGTGSAVRCSLGRLGRRVRVIWVVWRDPLPDTDCGGGSGCLAHPGRSERVA